MWSNWLWLSLSPNYLLLFFLSFLSKVRSFTPVPMSVQIMRSEGQRLVRRSTHVIFCDLKLLFLTHYLPKKCYLWYIKIFVACLGLILALSALLNEFDWFPSIQYVNGMLIEKSPLLQPITNTVVVQKPLACLHIYLEDTACCLTPPANYQVWLVPPVFPLNLFSVTATI